MATWAVVTTVRAPEHHVKRFIKHYLDAGARRIYIFFDDPDFAFPQNDDRLKQVVCDGEYWKNGRPGSIEDRQRFNARRALKWSDSDWLFHCDADELVTGHGPISAALATVPGNVASVLVPPYEAVYVHEPSQQDAFDTRYFKRPMKVETGYHPIVWECFGPLSRMTTGGFWGHLRGKSFYRKAFCDFIPIHRFEESINGHLVSYEVPGMKLLHFDTLTFIDWKEKSLRRLDGAVLAKEMGGRREQQIEAVRNARDKWGEWGLHDLYRRMAVFDGDLMRKAIEAGFVVEVDR